MNRFTRRRLTLIERVVAWRSVYSLLASVLW
jgi:hypothetical protein